MPIVVPPCVGTLHARLFRHHGSLWLMLLLRLLVDDGKHACLERLLILKQAHLLPLVVEHLGVHIVTLHAFVEEADAMAVVRLGIELKAAAVFHILFELERAAAAKVV